MSSSAVGDATPTASALTQAFARLNISTKGIKRAASAEPEGAPPAKVARTSGSPVASHTPMPDYLLRRIVRHMHIADEAIYAHNIMQNKQALRAIIQLSDVSRALRAIVTDMLPQMFIDGRYLRLDESETASLVLGLASHRNRHIHRAPTTLHDVVLSHNARLALAQLLSTVRNLLQWYISARTDEAPDNAPLVHWVQMWKPLSSLTSQRVLKHIDRACHDIPFNIVQAFEAPRSFAHAQQILNCCRIFDREQFDRLLEAHPKYKDVFTGKRSDEIERRVVVTMFGAPDPQAHMLACFDSIRLQLQILSECLDRRLAEPNPPLDVLPDPEALLIVPTLGAVTNVTRRAIDAMVWEALRPQFERLSFQSSPSFVATIRNMIDDPNAAASVVRIERTFKGRSLMKMLHSNLPADSDQCISYLRYWWPAILKMANALEQLDDPRND